MKSVRSLRGKQVYLSLLFLFVIVSMSFGLQNFNASNELTGAISTRTDKVTIVVYSDFLCEECAQAYTTLTALETIYDDELRLIYKHLPLHKESFVFAQASECADAQNKFWSYHDYLFEHQATLDSSEISDYAVELGLDAKTFDDCMQNRVSKANVETDFTDAVELGIDSTPTFFIAGERFDGTVEIETFKKAIDSAF